MKNVEAIEFYPRIHQLGLKITSSPIPHIKRKHLAEVLKKNKIDKLFHKYFGIQTCYIDGPYLHDVESVLERIFSGKLTGTQAFWD